MGKKSGQPSAAENIKVLVRCRPINEKEQAHGYKSCVDLDLTEHSVTVRSVIGDPDRWTFDAVINNTFSQRDIFTQFIMPLVDSVLEGFNATVFAYGQSGSGKTHTMTGRIGDKELEGLTPRCFTHVFDQVRAMQDSSSNRHYSMYVSFVEIYNGKVQDLLAKQQVPLAVKESKDKTFFVQGAHIPQVKCPEDIFRHMDEGTERRRVASTDLNADSSRSHSIFTLVIECIETAEDGDTRSVTSKLNLVDLAGSERQGKTGASGDTLKEGCNINLSLSALGTVIDTIVKGHGHIPFRSSPLTMLLKDSLGGSSKTVMFANIGPSEHNFSETVSTLRFADRAKQIKNKPVVNMDTKDQKILELTEQIHSMREKLKMYETGGVDSLEKELEELRERVGELEVSLDNAVKGREADIVDFENVKAKLNIERQNLTAQVVELEEQISQLQSDLQIAESSVSDERSQREEIFRLCTHYLRGEEEGSGKAEHGEASEMKPITKVDELEAVLRDRAHGKHNAKLVHLLSRVQELEVDANETRKEHSNIVKELQAKLHEAEKSQKSMQSALREVRKELNESRESMAAIQSSSVAVAATAALESNQSSDASLCVSTSAMEVLELRAALASAQQQLQEKSVAPKLDVILDKLQNSHELSTTACMRELQLVKETIGQAGTNDSLAMQQLRAILSEDQSTFTAAVEHVADAYALAAELRSALRAAEAVPLAAISGDASSARRVVQRLEDVDASEAKTHADLLAQMHNAVAVAQTHRNNLLDAIASSPDTPVDLRAEVQRVMHENNELRRLLAAEAARAEAAQTRAAEESRRGATQNAEVDAARRAYECRERELIAAIEADKAEEGEKAHMGNPDAHAHGRVLALMQRELVEQQQVGGAAAQEMRREAEALREELTELRAKADEAARARDAQREELKRQRREAAEATRRNAALEGKMREMKSEYERQIADAAEGMGAVAELEGRLRERSDQLDQMRGLLEKQKALIVKSNEKSEYFQQKLREAKAEMEYKEEVFHSKLQQRDENFQRVLNQRIEEYVAEHRTDVTQREEKSKKLKKKIKKIEGEIDKWKEEYDQKVCECEELRTIIEEQKVEQMRLLRRMGQTEEEADVYEKKEQIQNALDRAKEEQRRKKDLFALGEVTNNVRRSDH